ncbi:MAG TPA: hypothetical protein PLV15_02250, partial [Smithella sp.]|nr:hypothetical protein [Smithella sp.]
RGRGPRPTTINVGIDPRSIRAINGSFGERSLQNNVGRNRPRHSPGKGLRRKKITFGAIRDRALQKHIFM